MSNASSASVAIVTPMACEMQPYVEPLGLKPSAWLGQWQIREGRSAAGPVVALISGCGLVNTAAALAMLATRYRPLLALHSGCCGGHREDLLPGDVIIGQAAVQIGTGRADAGGEIDPCTPDLLHKVPGDNRQKHRLLADAHLVAAAREALEACPDLRAPWPFAESWPADLPTRDARCIRGTLGSQDQWTTDAATIRALRAVYGHDTEDCETSAFMQTAATLGIPALAVRCVCNNDAHLSLPLPSEALDAAIAEAARRAARGVLAILERPALRVDNG